MCVYGYARISTAKQSIDRQIRNIKAEYDNASIYQESYTGTTTDRPQWGKLMKRVKPGDTIVFDSVSRMSRNADEGFNTYLSLYSKGVQLVFLKEPHINTATYDKALNSGVQLTGDKVDYILEGVNKYLMALAKEQIKLAFEQAEKEVADLHIRTSEGIQTARENGKQIGQREGAKLKVKKAIKAKEIIRKHSMDFGGQLIDKEVIALCGISRNSYYKYKAEIRAEQSIFD